MVEKKKENKDIFIISVESFFVNEITQQTQENIAVDKLSFNGEKKKTHEH